MLYTGHHDEMLQEATSSGRTQGQTMRDSTTPNPHTQPKNSDTIGLAPEGTIGSAGAATPTPRSLSSTSMNVAGRSHEPGEYHVAVSHVDDLRIPSKKKPIAFKR